MLFRSYVGSILSAVEKQEGIDPTYAMWETSLKLILMKRYTLQLKHEMVFSLQLMQCRRTSLKRILQRKSSVHLIRWSSSVTDIQNVTFSVIDNYPRYN